MGMLRDALGSWRVPLGLCAILALAAVFMGFLAGRERHVDA